MKNLQTGVSLAANKNFLILAGGAVVVVLGLAWYTKKKITDTANAAGDAVNPLSDTNLANRAANALTQALTVKKDVTVGTSLFDWFNPTANATADALFGKNQVPVAKKMTTQK